MLQVRIYFGPPGTGKTARLLEDVKTELARGIRPAEIAFVAFSRKAAGEARERAVAELGFDPDDLTYWATLHSTAARQLGVGPGDLLTGAHWQELGDLLNMKLAAPDEAGRVAEHQARDSAVQAVVSLARARGTAPAEVWAARRRDRPGLMPVRLNQVALYERTLNAYKAEHRLLDYADLLDQAPGRLPVRVVFLDEAQDLTPAQWAYVQRLWAGAERVYVAGDDDQAIYDWAGADVQRFLGLEGERVVLDRSHRLPYALARLAWETSKRIKLRQPKDWAPAGESMGFIDVPARPERVPVAGGEWLLLGRTNSLVDRWEAVCRSEGVPYSRHGTPSVVPKHALAIRAWETWRRGGAPDEDALRTAQELCPLAYDRERAPPWREALTRITPAKRRYYEACLRRDPRALTDVPRVTLSTIHGAKGGEADHVGLLSDLTPRVYEGYRADPDAEHRVWYVACTRARESLHVVRPSGPLFYRY